MRTSVKVPAAGDAVEVPPGSVIVGIDGEGRFIIEVPDERGGDGVSDQQSFSTGAVRDTQDGKVLLDLLPWKELERVAEHYMRGCKKYKPRNWELGIPSSRCRQSLLRHVSALTQNKTDEDHLSAIVFNALAIMFNERALKDNPEINDLPGWKPE